MKSIADQLTAALAAARDFDKAVPSRMLVVVIDALEAARDDHEIRESRIEALEAKCAMLSVSLKHADAEAELLRDQLREARERRLTSLGFEAPDPRNTMAAALYGSQPAPVAEALPENWRREGGDVNTTCLMCAGPLASALDKQHETCRPCRRTVIERATPAPVSPAPVAEARDQERWLCGRNFPAGGTTLRCRRLNGHDGECRASRDENEQDVLDAFVKADRATREIRKAEVAGEHPAPVAEALPVGWTVGDRDGVTEWSNDIDTAWVKPDSSGAYVQTSCGHVADVPVAVLRALLTRAGKVGT